MISEMEYIDDFLHFLQDISSGGGSARGFCVTLSLAKLHILS